MSTLDVASLPYPGMNVEELQAKRLARLAPEDTALAQWFGSPPVVDVPASAVVVPAAEPTFTPLRRPGASLASRVVPVPSAGRVTNLALLTKVRDALRKSVAELADERARYALADIVYAAARQAEPPFGFYCPDCKATDSGWCDPCGRADEKAAGLYRLHDLILAVDTYAAAAVLVARPALPPKVTHAEGQR